MRSVALMFLGRMFVSFIPVFGILNPWMDSLTSWLVTAHGLEWIKLFVALWIFGVGAVYIIELSEYVPDHKWQVSAVCGLFLLIMIGLLQGTFGTWNWGDWRMIFTASLVLMCSLVGLARTVRKIEEKRKEAKA